MAQNDGTTTNQVVLSDGQEGSRPRLIGARSVLSYIGADDRPLHYQPLLVSDGMVSSLDMVRLTLRLSDPDWLLGHADAFTAVNETWSGHGGIGSYSVLWRYPIGDSAVVLGYGQRQGGGRVDRLSAFCEFNPNKTAFDERFVALMDRLRGHVDKVTVKRYDIAVDVVQSRNDLRLSKDRRKYQAVIDKTITEYLGQRNRGGFVKLYDKGAESGFGGPLTRIELTADGAWTADEIASHWPMVHSWSVAEGTQDWVKVVGMLLCAEVERGNEVETIIARLGRRSRDKVRSCMRSGVIDLPDEVIEHALTQAESWRSLLIS